VTAPVTRALTDVEREALAVLAAAGVGVGLTVPQINLHMTERRHLGDFGRELNALIPTGYVRRYRERRSATVRSPHKFELTPEGMTALIGVTP
jgi:hypothetical protein